MSKEREMEQEVLYPLEAKPPISITLLLGLQHVLAMFVGIITPPMIIANVLGFGVADASFLVNMALIVSGVTTFIQIKRRGPIGSGLLGVQGTSFTFLAAGKQAAAAGGMGMIVGLTIAAAPLEIIMSRLVRPAKKIFPPVVMGTVVTLIGLGLIQTGFKDMAGGQNAANFGSLQNILLGLFVLTTIIILSRFGKGLTSIGAVAIGLIIGYLVSIPLGLVEFSKLSEVGFITVPTPFKFGINFRWSLLVPWLIAYLITSIETMGDLTASAQNSGERVDTDLHMERLSGGVLADAIGSIIAGIFNSMPNTTFSQNNGVIILTKAGARVIGYAAGGILIALGLFPKIGALVSLMPKPVLGGATVAMFGLVAISGLKIIANDGLTERNLFILAISLSLGLGVTMVPEALAGLPQVLKDIFSSGMATGGIVATILHLTIPGGKEAVTTNNDISA